MRNNLLTVFWSIDNSMFQISLFHNICSLFGKILFVAIWLLLCFADAPLATALISLQIVAHSQIHQIFNNSPKNFFPNAALLYLFDQS